MSSSISSLCLLPVFKLCKLELCIVSMPVCAGASMRVCVCVWGGGGGRARACT